MDKMLLTSVLWHYLRLNQKLEKADAILVMGCTDTRVAERAAQLYLEGWAPKIIFSGGAGRITSKMRNKSEAEVFAEVAANMGVPKNRIYLEEKSSNTGQNISNTRELIENAGFNEINKMIVVCTAYAERRVFASFKKQWPEMDITVTSPQITHEEYIEVLWKKEGLTEEELISTIVGEVDRIKHYVHRGFIVPQEIDQNVEKAQGELINQGYSRNLL